MFLKNRQKLPLKFKKFKIPEGYILDELAFSSPNGLIRLHISSPSGWMFSIKKTMSGLLSMSGPM